MFFRFLVPFTFALLCCLGTASAYKAPGWANSYSAYLRVGGGFSGAPITLLDRSLGNTTPPSDPFTSSLVSALGDIGVGLNEMPKFLGMLKAPYLLELVQAMGIDSLLLDPSSFVNQLGSQTPDVVGLLNIEVGWNHYLPSHLFLGAGIGADVRFAPLDSGHVATFSGTPFAGSFADLKVRIGAHFSFKGNRLTAYGLGGFGFAINPSSGSLSRVVSYLQDHLGDVESFLSKYRWDLDNVCVDGDICSVGSGVIHGINSGMWVPENVHIVHALAEGVLNQVTGVLYDSSFGIGAGISVPHVGPEVGFGLALNSESYPVGVYLEASFSFLAGLIHTPAFEFIFVPRFSAGVQVGY